MPAVFQKTVEQDLHKPLKIQYCADTVFTKDNAGNQINVLLYEDGEPYNSGGTVSATAIRADGATESWAGTISGNTVSVALTRAALDVPGTLQVFIKVTSGTVETTVYAGVFNVVCTETPTVVAPVTPSDVAALIASIQAAIDNIPADWTSFLGTIAPTFDPSKEGGYAAGAYVWYPGQPDNVGTLYRFTSAHSGTWTGTDAVTVVIGNELNDTVRYTQQVHTDAEKTIARANIGAASNDGLYNLAAQVSTNTTDIDVIQRTIGNGLDPNNTVKSQLDSIKADIGTIPTGETIEGQIADLKAQIKPQKIVLSDGGIDTSGETVDITDVDHPGEVIHRTYELIGSAPGMDLTYSSVKDQYTDTPKTNPQTSSLIWNGTNGTFTRVAFDHFIPVHEGDRIVISTTYKVRLWIWNGAVGTASIQHEFDWSSQGETIDYTVTADGFMYPIFSYEGNDTAKWSDSHSGAMPISILNASIIITEASGTVVPSVHYAVVSCKANDFFTINSVGTSKYKRWCFIDSAGSVLDVSGNDTQTVFLKAPPNVAYLIINDTGDNASYSGAYKSFEEPPILAYALVNTSGNIPVLAENYTSANRNICLSSFYHVSAGEKIYIYTVAKHKIFIYSGLYGNACELTNSPAWVDGNGEYTILAEGFIMVAISLYGSNSHSGNEIDISTFDGFVKITKLGDTETVSTFFRIMTYNVGDYTGEGFTAGSDELLLEYRKAIMETNTQLCCCQADKNTVSPSDTVSPRNAIFRTFRYFNGVEAGDYNDMYFASNFRLYNVHSVSYNVSDATHPWMLVGMIELYGVPIMLATVHLDWKNVTLRRQEIQAIIDYFENYDNVIIAGDMNPFDNITPSFPQDATFVYDADFALFQNAGYRVGNGKELGCYDTLMSRPPHTETGIYTVVDSVFAKGNIIITNVGTTVRQYMNDHCIFFSDIQIELKKDKHVLIT